MKKQSRSISVIYYGYEPVSHDLCDLDMKKCLRECVGDLPLYAVMNSLMRIAMNIHASATDIIIDREDNCFHKEPHLKVMCATPVSLRANTTPPGTDYNTYQITTTSPLPALPQLAGSKAPPTSTLAEMNEESSDDSSSVSESKDQPFMLSPQQRKCRVHPTTRIGKEYDTWLLTLLPKHPLTTNKFLTLQKSFLWEFPVTPNIFITIQRSSKWKDTLIRLCEYVQSINALDIDKIHPCHNLYRSVFHQLQAWCTLLKCADGALLFDKYRSRLTSKVSSLTQGITLPSTYTSEITKEDVSLESIIKIGRRLEEFIVNTYTMYQYE